MDLCNDMTCRCRSFVLQGLGGLSKTQFMKAVVGRVFGEGDFVTNSLKQLGTYAHLLVSNSVILFGDFTWDIALNSNGLLNIECAKGLLRCGRCVSAGSGGSGGGRGSGWSAVVVGISGGASGSGRQRGVAL